ncbi:hypothetical protein C2S51_006124 [Perilla frutescens var. frutescens]|nr:hypothetical protein C2S51_006124 [Perilla frutescens var. frutescens]
MGFDGGLKKPPTDALRPIIPDNACILYVIMAVGTELADAYSPDTVIASSPEKEVLIHRFAGKDSTFSQPISRPVGFGCTSQVSAMMKKLTLETHI